MSTRRRSRAREARAAERARPSGVALLHQGWRHLLFAHWTIPPEQLARRLPASLPIDTWQGQAYLGLVAFVVENNRLTLMPPFPLFGHFYEVNLRTYVRPPGSEPGVYFFSLDASNPFIAAAARTFYGLPYESARARFAKAPLPGKPTTLSMSFRRASAGGKQGAGCSLLYTPSGGVAPAAPGTLASFLVERYVLYTVSGGSIHAVRVHHEPYPLQGARIHRLDETLTAAAGLPPPGRPSHAHYARGVDVRIYAPS